MSFLGALTGSDSRRYAQNAREENQRQLTAGYDANRGYATNAYNTATGRLSPYEQGGRSAYQSYQNFLGMNGQPAQQSALSAYSGFNPYMQAEQQRLMQAGDRRAAATGQFGSGMNALARARVSDETAYRNYSDYLGRLGGMAQQGVSTAGQMAGLDTNYGNTMIGVENNLRQGNVNNQTQYYNALDRANQSGAQNIIGLGGLAVQGLGMFGGGGGLGSLGSRTMMSQPGTAANGGWSTTAQTPSWWQQGANFFGMR